MEKSPPLWHLTATGKRHNGAPDTLRNANPPFLRGRVDCHGNAINIFGNVSALRGDVSALRGDVTNIWGTIHETLSGNVSDLKGNITALRGDVSSRSDDLTFAP